MRDQEKNCERAGSVLCPSTKKKKDIQLENCELSFIWGKMRTEAEEMAPLVALRDRSKEAVEEGQYIRFGGRRSSVQSSTYFTKGFPLVTRS